MGPSFGIPSPGYTIEGITNNPGPTTWQSQGLRVTGTNPPQDTRFAGPAPIFRRSRDGQWLPTALLLASFIISECADPSDYYQAEVGSALAISLSPSPLASNLPRYLGRIGVFVQPHPVFPPPDTKDG